ncbi:uncharacterized [Tachysurus ichikawai]
MGMEIGRQGELHESIHPHTDTAGSVRAVLQCREGRRARKPRPEMLLSHLRPRLKGYVQVLERDEEIYADHSRPTGFLIMTRKRRWKSKPPTLAFDSSTV